MDPIEAFENLVITFIAGFALVQLVVFICAPILAIVILVWWLQTLMLCLREETGDDKTTYTLVIVFLGPLGALIYRLSRTGRVPGAVRARRSQEPDPAPWLKHPSGTPRQSRISAGEPPHYTTGQVVTISIASLLVGMMLVCISLVAFSAWYEPPLPTAATTPSAAEQFATEGPEAIMGTVSAIATESSEVMRTSAAP